MSGWLTSPWTLGALAAVCVMLLAIIVWLLRADVRRRNRRGGMIDPSTFISIRRQGVDWPVRTDGYTARDEGCWPLFHIFDRGYSVDDAVRARSDPRPR